jgi:hypothetical protein
VVATALAVVLGGCNSGTYPLDVFSEMHYQPSHRPLEPERRAPPLLTYAQAANLQNPFAQDPTVLERARQVYLVNCSSCHGHAGDGHGPLAAYYVNSPVAPVPPASGTCRRTKTC